MHRIRAERQLLNSPLINLVGMFFSKLLIGRKAMFLYRPMSSRKNVEFPLTDAFIDANSMETIDIIDTIDKSPLFSETGWTQ